MEDGYAQMLVELDEKSGVMTVDMGRLRDMQGAGKLGVYVIGGIKQALESHGIGHYPQELPKNQYDQVRLYKKGTALAKFIESTTTVGEDHDEYIRDNINNNSQAVLQKIRELVCD
jgi:hypothetical protein